MTDFVKYDTLLADFQAAVQGANLGFKQVLIDANDRDFIFNNMPLLDLRVKRSLPEPVTNQTYYTEVTVEAEVTVFDMTNRREAAKLRNDLTNALQRYVKDHPRFSGIVETVVIGQVDFLTGESKAEGAFVAGAVCQFQARLYTE